MTAKNDITGDVIQTKQTSDKYRQGFDAIDWSKKLEKQAPKETKQEKK
jgi:hypothetical protein